MILVSNVRVALDTTTQIIAGCCSSSSSSSSSSWRRSRRKEKRKAKAERNQKNEEREKEREREREREREGERRRDRKQIPPFHFASPTPPPLDVPSPRVVYWPFHSAAAVTSSMKRPISLPRFQEILPLAFRHLPPPPPPIMTQQSQCRQTQSTRH